MAQD
jgi:hypothetical protein